MHCTYPPSSPGSPPWQRSPDCSVISTLAQPYSFLIQIPLSCLFPPAPRFLPPFMSLFLLPAWISSLSLLQPTLPSTLFLSNPSWFVLSHTHMHTHKHCLSSLKLELIWPWSSSVSLPLPLSLQDTAGRSWTFVMLLLLLLPEPTPTPNEWWDSSEEGK